MIKVYNDSLYYFVDNKENKHHKDLRSIPLDKNTESIEVLKKVNCYIDERWKKGNFYVNTANTIFYDNGSNALFKKVDGTSPQKLSKYENDNYVFAQDAIYFRKHAIEKNGERKGFYGIAKGNTCKRSAGHQCGST